MYRELVIGIRQIEMAMGTNVKAIQPSEEPCHQKLGKSVVSLKKLNAGTRFDQYKTLYHIKC